MKICPSCGATAFAVTAHVTQDWVVDLHENFLECTQEHVETTHHPDDDDIWSCADCDYFGSGSDFNVVVVRQIADYYVVKAYEVVNRSDKLGSVQTAYSSLTYASEVARGIANKGGTPEILTRYAVLDSNGKTPNTTEPFFETEEEAVEDIDYIIHRKKQEVKTSEKTK